MEELSKPTLRTSYKIPTQRNLIRKPMTRMEDNSRRGTLINGLINSSKEMFTMKKESCEDRAIEHFKNQKFDINDKTDSFENYFTELKILGEGTSSVVKLCLNNDTNKKYAVKYLRSSEEDIIKQAKNEFYNLKLFDSEGIIKAYELFHNKSNCILHTVLEYCENSQNLTDYIKSNGPLNEVHCRNLFRLLLNAISDMHREGLCHRDLKPDNLLIVDDDQVKIIDFNICKKKIIFYDYKSKKNLSLLTHIGTLEYSAPELLQGYSEYSEQVDIWGAGIILHYMISGENPFKGLNQKDTIDKIVEGNLYLDGNVWENISTEGINMIRGLLKVDPNERLNVHEALNHSWMKISSLNIVKNKFRNDAGIFGDSFENAFTNLSICDDNSNLKSFYEFANLMQGESNEHNCYREDESHNNKQNGKNVSRTRSESI